MKIGLQLYSVRDKLGNDFEGTLKAVADMGFEYVEFAGYYYEKSAEELKAILDKYGLKAISVHNRDDWFIENMCEKIEFLKDLGVKHVGIPGRMLSWHKGGENFPEFITRIKMLSKALKEKGMDLGYHNHHWEFGLYDGMPLMDWLLRTVDGETLKAEFDVGWVKYSNCDPCEYLKKYAGRCPVIHLKDYVEKFEGEYPNDHRYMDGRAIGSGVQNIPEILKAAEEAGVEYAIVEDENGDIDSLEMVRESRNYLKSIGY